jgi:GT2 family glycosyltransferase
MRVAAIIPHWNRSDLLSELLSSVSKQTRPFDHVLIVDNGSTDDSVQVAEASGAQFLRLGSNQGFAHAVNRGIRETTADWIAILNNDVVLHPTWLESLLAGAGQAHFATGKILSAADPSKIDATFDEIARSSCAWRCGSGKPDSPLWNQPRQIRIAPMTAALFRSSLFEEIGLLDESFGSYLEDVDFGLRCALHGKSGSYNPKAVATHRGSATLGQWSPDTVFRIARNQRLITAKHFQGQPRFPIVAGQLLWGLLALRHGRGRDYLRGRREGKRFPVSKTAEPAALKQVLAASERNIYDLQRQTGFDLYWRAYFWLSRP